MHPVYTSNEFIGVSSEQLQENINTSRDLIAWHRDSGFDDGSIAYLIADLECMEAEADRRRARAERYKNDPHAPQWPDPSRIEVLREAAQTLKAELGIEEYLNRVAPRPMQQSGHRLKCRCPFPDHDDRTPSFIVYEDDHAWCHGCNRGGDLFRIVGLVEGIERFRDQLRRVADMVGRDLPDTSQSRSFTAPSTKGAVNRERSGRGRIFEPIKVVNGKVAP
jgi:hypothetical protein